MSQPHIASVSPPRSDLGPSGVGAGPTEVARPDAPPSAASRDPVGGVARWLHLRGMTDESLQAFGLVFVVVSAFFLVFEHPGLGGLFGLVALAFVRLARVPSTPTLTDAAPVVRALDPLVDLVVPAAVLAGVAVRQPFVVSALALLVLVLFAWLPRLAAACRELLPRTPVPDLWSRFDRMSLLLVGALIGPLWLALLALVTVGGIEAWLRLEQIANAAARRLPPRLFTPEARLTPLARWGSLGLLALLLLLLPAGPYWRL